MVRAVPVLKIPVPAVPPGSFFFFSFCVSVQSNREARFRLRFLDNAQESFWVLFLSFIPCKAKVTLQGNLGNFNFVLVLTSIFGGSPKITLQNKITRKAKK